MNSGVGRGLLTVQEAADWLGISRSKTYELLGAGELPYVRLGRQTRLPLAALERWVEERTERAPAPRASAAPTPPTPAGVPCRECGSRPAHTHSGKALLCFKCHKEHLAARRSNHA